MTQSEDIKPLTPVVNKDAEYSVILATFKAISKILAIKFFLFLSLVGSFVLSVIATNNQSVQSAWVLVLYACVTTLPLTVLEFRSKLGV